MRSRHNRTSTGALLPKPSLRRVLSGDGRQGSFNRERDNPGTWTRGLLIRRRIDDGELAFFATWCPVGTSIQILVQVEGRRWAIEDSFETAKNELGLDHNETRSWHGWHRHVSLVMLAFAMLAAIRKQANQVTPKKSPAKTSTLRPN